MAVNFALGKKLGAIFKAFTGTKPAALAAGSRNGVGVDRAAPGGVLYGGCTLVAKTGAETGGPSARTLDAKLQDSADNSTFADYKPDGVNVAAIAQIAAVDTVAEVDVDLSNARRYIRVVDTVGFTGGTTPTLGADTTLVLYGGDRAPV